MFKFFEFDDMPPPEIVWFERLWLSTLALSVIITVTMFEWSSGRLGPLGAAALTSFRFGGTYLLMFLCTRLHSNFFRWVIAVPFNLTIVGYDFIRLPDMLEHDPIIWVVALRLLVTFACTYLLFRPRAREWFGGRPAPEPDYAEAQ